MIFSFANKEDRKVCEDEESARSRLGESATMALKKRLSDLRAATTISDVPTARSVQIDNADDSKYEISLDSFRLIICVGDTKKPIGKNGKIDWSKVDRVKILEIQEKNE